MKTKTTVLLIIILIVLSLLLGYFVLFALLKPTATGIGENVFGTSQSISPPSLP